MSPDSNNPDAAPGPEPSGENIAATEAVSMSVPGLGQPTRGFRIGRLASKELRETLRDRRTVVTLLLMPLLVYPILSIAFSSFLLSNADRLGGGEGGAGEPMKFKVAYGGDGTEEELTRSLQGIAAAIKRGNMVKRRAEIRKQKALNENAGIQPTQSSDDLANDASASDSTDEEDGATEKRGGIAEFENHIWLYVPHDGEKTIDEMVRDGDADVGLRLTQKDITKYQFATGQVIVSDAFSSQRAFAYFDGAFQQVNTLMFRALLREARKPRDFAVDLEVSKIQSSTPKGQAGVSLAALMPLILVLMTITGAVYPAIDLTAGERERGTLETLMAAPVPRMSILVSKFIAVLTVAVLTASLNIIGMMVTLWSFPQLYEMVFAGNGMSFLVVLKIFGLLVLFAAFFSAMLLAVTSYARSFKEAQAYLVPIILLSITPGLMTMTPGLSLAGPLAVVPMVNILLLARDVLQNSVEFVPALVTVISTLLYATLGIFVAARIFGTDAILYGSQGSWGDLVNRPREKRLIAPTSAALFCLTLLFPLNFVLIGILGRIGDDLTLRMWLMGAFTFATFLLFPLVVARYQRIRTATCFGTLPTRPIYYLAAILLGISLWPIVMTIISGWHDLYSMIAGVEESGEWHDRLVKFSNEAAERLRAVPAPMIAIALAVIPAIAEEWFFRGMLMRSLLKVRGKWFAILMSAGLFGLFHVLSNSVVALDRLVPTALMGIMLGYLCYKSNSIVPGIILHMLHNGIVAFLAYYQPKLSELEWFPDASQPIPLTWVLIALIPASFGVLLVCRAKRVGTLGPDAPDGKKHN